MWVVCAVISLIFLLLAGCVFFNKKISSMRMIFVTVGIFLATYVIYLPAVLAETSGFEGVLGNLVHALQVTTLDASFFEFNEIIKIGTNSVYLKTLYTVIRGIVHFLMPIVSAMTAVTILLRCYSSIQMFFANRSKKEMYIFSEYNERSLQFAKSLDEKKSKIVFMGMDENALTNSSEETKKFILKEEKISDLQLKGIRDKEVYYFCVSEDEDKSLSQALGLIDKLSKLEESIQEKVHIYLFSKFNDFSIYVDSAEKGALNVHCVNEYETQVYQLIDKYPLFDVGSSKIHVLLHGLSEVNKVALKAIAWCGQLDGYSLKISVVGINIKDAVESLKVQIPNIFTKRFDLNVYDCENDKQILDTISEKCSDANYVILSEKNDNETMEKGVSLRRLFYTIDKEFKSCPKIFCYVTDVFKHNLLKNLATAEVNPKRKMSYDLIPFGCIDQVYSYDSLINSPLEYLSKNVHMAYEEIFSDGPIDVKEALKRYNLFEVNKRSNRANALHIRYKLRLLGLDYTEDENARTENLEEYFTEESLERLAISEHDRWMTFLETEGWTKATKEDVYAYRNSDLSKGRHNCPLLKKHPYICEYEALKELSLELEGKDTTVYDSELIVRIPDILVDKWNVSGKKYKIYKS